MMCKVCNRCAPEVEFYNSIATFCKEHWRERVRLNREAKPEHYRELSRKRAMLPDNVERRRLYALTPVGKVVSAKAHKRWKERNPHKRKAQIIVNNALRDGKIYPVPCLVCGKDAEAHHPDYDRPLDVIWLCKTHHRQVHVLAEQYEN